MSNAILSKFHREIHPVNNENVVNSMLMKLVNMTPIIQEDWWARDPEVGFVCSYFNEDHPEYVLEYVQGGKEDSVTTLYKRNPWMMERTRLVDMRKQLIGEIARVLMALPSTVAVRDEGRGREVMLKELGTAQLIDVLAHFTHTDLKSA